VRHVPHRDKPDYADYRKAVRRYVDALRALKEKTLKRIEESRRLLAKDAGEPKDSLPDHKDRDRGLL
jgi:hypothetical protein